MKAKELAEKLLEYPDFDVNIVLDNGITDGSHIPWPNYRLFNINGIGDIGHSDKIIQLEVEETI